MSQRERFERSGSFGVAVAIGLVLGAVQSSAAQRVKSYGEPPGGALEVPATEPAGVAGGLATAGGDDEGASYASSMGPLDCDHDGIPDSDELASGREQDCNANGTPDSCDIVEGYSLDCDGNGVPDSCEFGQLAVQPLCLCASGAPCGNVDPFAGCANSSGAGSYVEACYSTSLGADDLVLRAVNVPPHRFGVFFMGATQTQLAFGNGQLCVNGTGPGLFRYPPGDSGASGVIVLGPGIVAHAAAHFGALGTPTAGQSWFYQCLYRDPLGPCGSSFNLTNTMEVVWGP